MMCVRVCKRKRERGSYTYEHKIKWGMNDYIKNTHNEVSIDLMCKGAHV